MAKTGLQGLVAYQVALELAETMFALECKGSIRDQLTRASESVVLNIAEAHPMTGNDRAKRFRVALGEASECRGALAILRIRKLLTPAEYEKHMALVDRACALLYPLSLRKEV